MGCKFCAEQVSQICIPKKNANMKWNYFGTDAGVWTKYEHFAIFSWQRGGDTLYFWGNIIHTRWWDFHDKDQGLVLYFHMWDIFIAKRGNDIIFLGAIFYVGSPAKWHLLTLADSLTATKDRNQVLHKMQNSQWLVKTSKNKSKFWSRPFLYGQVEEFRLGEAMPH